MKSLPIQREKSIIKTVGICDICLEEMVEHPTGIDRKGHHMIYPGNGVKCSVDNCQFNHGKGKCDTE